jgi:hypothetical protein
MQHKQVGIAGEYPVGLTGHRKLKAFVITWITADLQRLGRYDLFASIDIPAIFWSDEYFGEFGKRATGKKYGLSASKVIELVSNR